MSALPAAALADLRAVLGEAHVLSQGEALAAYQTDRRGRYHGRAAAVLRPADTAQLAALMRIAQAYRLPVVPQGGNTGLVGGSVPDESGGELLVSLRRLDRIRALDTTNRTLTVEAGCILQTAQQAAAEAGLLLPLSLAAEGSCTIGGNLASNAGGVQVLRWGNARELCLGLEVVTPQGEVWDGLRGLRKDNSGYDLRDLYIGSEGTLGFISAAVLKLVDAPRGQATALVQVAGPDAALALLQLALARSGATLTAFELMNPQAVALVAQQLPQALPAGIGADPEDPAAPWQVLLEWSDSHDADAARQRLETSLAEALAQGLAGEARVAQSLSQAQAFWRLRESIPLAQAAHGLNIKHDIALPVSRIPAFVREADATLQALCPGARPVNFGHLGDGNLHYNVMAPLGVAPAGFLREQEVRVNAAVHAVVERHGGSISAEHGIGRLKREALQQHQHPVALALMRRLKAALDPLNLMNPGRLL